MRDRIPLSPGYVLWKLQGWDNRYYIFIFLSCNCLPRCVPTTIAVLQHNKDCTDPRCSLCTLVNQHLEDIAQLYNIQTAGCSILQSTYPACHNAQSKEIICFESPLLCFRVKCTEIYIYIGVRNIQFSRICM